MTRSVLHKSPALTFSLFQIALIFWKGGNSLFHAAALLQKFNIYKDMKKQFSDEDAMDQATRVLLATLSIPEGAENPSILTKHLDIEEQHSANIRCTYSYHIDSFRIFR